jgi:hypothetical protein
VPLSGPAKGFQTFPVHILFNAWQLHDKNSLFKFITGVTTMDKTTLKVTSKTRPYRDDYDLDFNFDFRLSLTDYLLVALYMALVLPVEIINRIITDCYSAYRERRKRQEEMMPLFME